MTDNKKLFWLIMPLVMFGPLGIDIFLPAITKMQTHFNASQEQIQATITLYIIAVGLGYIFTGPLADKYGRKKTAVFGLLFYGISSAIVTMTSDTNTLFVMRFIQGFSACASSVSAYAIVRDRYSPTDAAKMFSYLNGMLCLIPALAPALGGLLTININWQANFWFMTLFALAIIILCMVKLPETNTSTPQQHKVLKRFYKILKNRDFVTFAFVNMVGMTCILLYVTYAPIVLMDTLQQSELEFSFWFGVNGFVNVVTFLLAPKVIDWLTRIKTVYLGLMFVFTGCVGEIVVNQLGLTSPIQYMVPVAVLSVGFSLMLGCAASFALAPFGEQAGTAAGLLGCIQMSGAAALATLIQQTSFNGMEALGYTGLCLTVVCAILLFFRPDNAETE